MKLYRINEDAGEVVVRVGIVGIETVGRYVAAVAFPTGSRWAECCRNRYSCSTV
jgi:hypothetical protein